MGILPNHRLNYNRWSNLSLKEKLCKPDRQFLVAHIFMYSLTLVSKSSCQGIDTHEGSFGLLRYLDRIELQNGVSFSTVGHPLFPTTRSQGSALPGISFRYRSIQLFEFVSIWLLHLRFLSKFQSATCRYATITAAIMFHNYSSKLMF